MNTPSERIRLIQEISTELALQDWPVIDLTLRQFGLPTTDEWTAGDKEGYIIHMIDSADDEILAQLKYHLTGQRSKGYSSESIDFWQPGRYKVFMSHVSKYKKFATDLRGHLEQFHISVFVAHIDIKPTREWMEEIQLALLTADCVLALMTEDFHKSNWTDQEIGVAMGQNKLIIPIDLGSTVYGFLSKYQWLKASITDPQDISQKVFGVLNKHNLSKRKFAEAIVNKFESSYSFVNARENIGLLEKLEYLDEDLIKRIENALYQNTQIKESFGVPNRVNLLIQKNRKV